MRFWSRILVFAIVSMVGACAGDQKPASPKKTFETYIKALQQKDTTTMKLLLSSGTIRMHEQEAKAQGVTVDDIVKRETLLSEGQKTVKYRNEKIDGDKANLEVMTPGGRWETVPFLREDGVWKIDKQGYAEQIIRDVDEEQNRKFEELRNFDPQPRTP